MQDFDIIKTNDIEETYRVSRIMGDFDVKKDHVNEHFKGTISTPPPRKMGDRRYCRRKRYG